ncbi:MAG: S46 family peptidase, partial [Flavobacteriales bacterium]
MNTKLIPAFLSSTPQHEIEPMINRFTPLFLLATFVLSHASIEAKEGMWIPTLLQAVEGYMQAMGLHLTAEDIYSINEGSLKDAIVHFNGGCTAEMISGEGLLLTNHHCGYGEIAYHSTVENDYLTDGFWAMTRAEELANPNL